MAIIGLGLGAPLNCADHTTFEFDGKRLGFGVGEICSHLGSHVVIASPPPAHLGPGPNRSEHRDVISRRRSQRNKRATQDRRHYVSFASDSSRSLSSTWINAS